MNERRLELAVSDPTRLGGRPRKPTPTEARELALQELRPKALQVLAEQLDHRDASIRQRAAIRVLEYTDGRPVQAIESSLRDAPTVIVFETAARTDGLPFEERPDGAKESPSGEVEP